MWSKRRDQSRMPRTSSRRKLGIEEVPDHPILDDDIQHGHAIESVP